MKLVQVQYHHEREGWWAASEDIPGWSAAGETFDEVRAMVREGVREFAGADALLAEIGVPVVAVRSWSGISTSSPSAASHANPRTGAAVFVAWGTRRVAVARYAPPSAEPVQDGAVLELKHAG